MTYPTTASIEQYYFIKDNVVFNISKENPNDDSCAQLMGGEDGEQKLPYLDVKKDGENDATRYYLDLYIQDGDKYNDTGFTKTGHDNQAQESGITYTDYFLYLCDKEIKQAILNNKYANFDDFKSRTYLLNVPAYAIKDNGYTVSDKNGDVNLINFNSEYFAQKKKEAVMEVALKAAKDTAKPYGYKVTNTSLTLEEI